MVGNLLAGLVLSLASPEFIAATPYVANPRILPEIHSHIRQAADSLRSGEFNRSIACTDTLLFVEAIRFRVDSYADSGASEERQRQALTNAISLWQSALENEIRFVESEDPIVTFHFQEKLENRSREVGGHVKWRRDISISASGEFAPNVKADIWIRCKQPSGRAMSLEAMTHVAAHELGHVLGMNDSANVGDIMGPLDLKRPAKRIAHEEIEALEDVRNRALTLRRSGLISALQELEGYNLSRAAR